MSSAHSHSSNDHGDHCEDDVERTLIGCPTGCFFCVEVFGDDVELQKDDIHVTVFSDSAGRKITLPCPDELECPHSVLIIARGGSVTVQNVGDNGDETFVVPSNRSVRFNVAGSDDDCKDSHVWIPECCFEALNGNGTGTFSARRR